MLDFLDGEYSYHDNISSVNKTSGITDLPTTVYTSTCVSNLSYLSNITQPTGSTKAVLRHSDEDNVEENIGIIVSLLIQLLAFPLCFIGNFMVFFILAKHRRLRTNANYYVLNLSVADFLVGTLVIPLETCINAFELIHKNSIKLYSLCIIHRFLLVFLLGSSLTAMLLISVDRYLGINHPFFYTEKVTGTVIRRTIVLSWILMVLLTAPILLPLRDPTSIIMCKLPKLSELSDYPEAIGYGIVLYVAVMIIFIGNIVLYLWVARIAVIQHMRVSSEMGQHHNHTRNDMRSTRAMILMFGVFIIFWLPFMFVMTIQLSDYCKTNNNKSVACFTTHTVALSLGVLNSCVNCYIFAWQKRDFKQAIRKSFLTKKPRMNRISSIHTATLPVTLRRPQGRNNSAESTFTITSRIATRRTEISLMATVGSESEADFQTTNELSCNTTSQVSFDNLKTVESAGSGLFKLPTQRRSSLEHNNRLFNGAENKKINSLGKLQGGRVLERIDSVDPTAELDAVSTEPDKEHADHDLTTPSISHINTDNITEANIENTPDDDDDPGITMTARVLS